MKDPHQVVRHQGLCYLPCRLRLEKQVPISLMSRTTVPLLMFWTCHLEWQQHQKAQLPVLPGYHSNRSHSIGVLVPSYVKLKDVKREPEAHLGVVFPMVVGAGVRSLVATREPRAELCTARPTEVAADVNFLGAQRAQRVVLIFV